MHEEFDLIAGDGTRLTAWRNGTVDGPPVLICNGMGVPPEAWPRLLDESCEFSVVGWVEVPSYDPATHRLVWSVAARPKEPRAGGDGVNYNTYVLGREGYFSMNLVTSMDRVELEKPVAREILAALSFNEGKRYADFNAATDRMAEYGLAALVGGLAAKKLGLLATAGIFIAKFWKIGLLAMAGAGAGASTWLKRKKNSD